MRKIGMMFGVLGLSSIFLISCSNTTERVVEKTPVTTQKSEVEESVGTQENQPIKVKIPLEYEAIIEKWVEENPTIPVQQLSVEDKLIEADIIVGTLDKDIEKMIENKEIIDLDTIKLSIPSYGKNILPSTVSMMQYGADSKAYGIPLEGVAQGLFCNKELFEQYNLRLPTTWENLQLAINGLTQQQKLPIATSFTEMAPYWVDQLLVGIEKKDKGLLAEGLIALKDLYDKGAFSEDVFTNSALAAKEAFIQKKAAMMLDTTLFISDMKDQENTVIVPFPVPTTVDVSGKRLVATENKGLFITKKGWEDGKRQAVVIQLAKTFISSDSIREGLLHKEGIIATVLVKDLPGVSPLNRMGMQLATKVTTIGSPVNTTLEKEIFGQLVARLAAFLAGEETMDAMIEEVLAVE